MEQNPFLKALARGDRLARQLEKEAGRKLTIKEMERELARKAKTRGN